MSRLFTVAVLLWTSFRVLNDVDRVAFPNLALRRNERQVLKLIDRCARRCLRGHRDNRIIEPLVVDESGWVRA